MTHRVLPVTSFLTGMAVFAVVVATSTVMGAAVAALVVIGGIAAFYFPRLPSLYLALLGVALAGYAIFGRPFAYLGFAPLYAGEALLALGLATLITRGDLREWTRSPIVAFLLVFMVYGAVRTGPYLSEYGLDALRDAAVWGYGLFALVVASAIRSTNTILSALRAYAWLVPVFLILAPATIIVDALFGHYLPPVPGSSVPLLAAKPGDVALHLTAIMAFMILIVPHIYPRWPRGGWWSREWLVWIVWFFALLTTLSTRAALVTLALVVIFLFLVKPTVRWWRPIALVAFMGLIAWGFDLSFELRSGREISVQGLETAVQSVVAPVSAGNLSATRSWRLEWWQKIIDYTVFGPYFWTGKGYGVNLADDDGFQVLRESALRSPHNAHLTLLARGGVPALVLWILLQGTFMLAFVRAYLLRLVEGRQAWADLNLWILAVWLAFMANATFDVFLEGPQGGIWFWSLFGFGIAVLRLQAPKALRLEPPPRRGSPDPGRRPLRVRPVPPRSKERFPVVFE